MALTAIGLVFCAAVAWPIYRAVAPKPPDSTPTAALAGDLKIPTVTVAPVDVGPLRLEITLPGTIAPKQKTTLLSKISGYLQTITVDRGDWIAKDQFLAQIWAPELEQDLCTAEAEVATTTSQAAEARLAVAEAEGVVHELEQAAANASNQIQISEIAVRQAEAHVAEAEAVLLAAQGEVELQTATYQRVAELFETRAATPQERDQQEARQRSARAALILAEAKLATARLEVDRARARAASVLSDMNLAATRVSTARARVQAAQARVLTADAKQKSAESASKRFAFIEDYSTILAPFSGVVTTRHADPGALIPSSANSQNQASAIVSVADISTVRVLLDVPERNVPDVHIGSTCRLSSDALPAREITGRIARIGRSLDPRTRTMVAEAEFDNPRSGTETAPEFALYPGMFVRVRLQLRTTHEARTVPSAAIAIEETRPLVYVVRDGKIRKLAVILGHDDGLRVQILNDVLSSGDVVIVGNKAGLQDGQVVRPSGPGTMASGS